MQSRLRCEILFLQNHDIFEAFLDPAHLGENYLEQLGELPEGDRNGIEEILRALSMVRNWVDQSEGPGRKLALKTHVALHRILSEKITDENHDQQVAEALQEETAFHRRLNAPGFRLE